ncbi:MAG: zinc ribbon domain-containing protein [Eggerthellaceae bacterium]|nr:zinc ribbon domain-containing protein [Eggerthellaceae bacterium]
MFCPKCGNQVSDGAKFCPKCGHNIGSGGEAAPIPGPTPQPRFVPLPGPIPGTLYERKLAQATSEGLGMNWYKFIIYVQCFLGGLSGLVSGVTQILGLQYGDSASLVYGYYSGLKIVDVVYGISSIVVGVLTVYARFGLKKFKADSVGIYLFLPLVNAIAAILYLLVASIVLHTSLFDSNLVSGGTIGLIVGSIVLFIANYIYFGRRRHLFNEA